MNAEEYRQRHPRAHILKCDDGSEFKVKRVGRLALLSQGLLPGYLVSQVSSNWRRTQGGEASTPEGLSGETAKVMAAVVCAACVEPRVVMGEPKEGELNIFEDLEDDHILRIFQWAMNGAQGAAVLTTDGEVEVSDLHRFPATVERGAVDLTGSNGADVRREALEPAGHP